MSDCCSWLTRQRCYRGQSQNTYIHLYTPTMANSSSSLCHCFLCTVLGLCLTFVLLLIAASIYHLNTRDLSARPTIKTGQSVSPIAKKRQLQDFVNTNIDPCENFYEFVCDKWIQENKIESYREQEDHAQKWTRIRHTIHNQLMLNLSNYQVRSNEHDFSTVPLPIVKLYQLCETQSPSLLIDELERFFALIIQQEPYRSHLTLFNRVKSINSISSPVLLQYNPFFKTISSSSDSLNQSFLTLIRTNHRPLLSPIAILPNLTILNQTALSHLIKFNDDYIKFLYEANNTIRLYEQEYNQDSLIIKRILNFSDYHICLSSLTTGDGLQKLIQLLNRFLQYRLHKFNTKLIDKQIRILEKITNNHTLVEHLRRIQLEFKLLEQIVPIDNQYDDHNSSCIIDLLDKLLDKRMTSDELSIPINFYSENQTTEYFISNDWPYLMMLHDRLLSKISPDTLVNYVFFDYYRDLTYPYYQPHFPRSIGFNQNYKNKSYHYMHDTNYFNKSCHINTCFDILNCYHPSLLFQALNDKNKISLDSIKTTAQNVISRFRFIIEQSDHLHITERKILLHELNQIKIQINDYSSSAYSFLNLKTSSYLEYVQLFSSISYDHQEYLFSTEPIYDPLNHTLFLPYGFIYLSNHSIEYPLVKFLLKILTQSIQSNPFYIECLIKSFDDLNSTLIDFNDEHIAYLLFRSKFLSEQNIVFDEYLWPFMSANALIKRFLIDYTANNYCQSFDAHQSFLNNTYLLDDVHLVFHCQQASTITQSKCTVN